MTEQKIIQGDCLEVMRGFADKSFDLVLTDPPYGIGKDFANDEVDDEKLYGFLCAVSAELYRVCKYNLVIEVAKNKLPLFLSAFKKWKYEYCLVLHTNNGMRNGKVGFNEFSLVLWFTNEKRSINRKKDHFSYALENNIKVFNHPSPKGTKHYMELMHMFSNDGDTILDPFMGSGTTLIAAKQLNRNATGIEISPEYCKIAQDRLNAQPNSLFSPTPGVSE